MRRSGATRVVYLIGRWAIKRPRIDGWPKVLQGLLANLQERRFSRFADETFCPVLFADPLGMVVVMRRAQTIGHALPDAVFTELTRVEDCEGNEYHHTLFDNSPHNFGWLGNRFVAVDYGS
jgi:hypothetical protein